MSYPISRTLRTVILQLRGYAGNILFYDFWPEILREIENLNYAHAGSDESVRSVFLDWYYPGDGLAVSCVDILVGESISGLNLGNFLGTVLVVIFADFWSALTNRQVSLVLLPSVVFLVSGSIGFRGFVAMSAGNTALGQQEFIQMFVVAACIAAGLIVGNSVYKPRISL